MNVCVVALGEIGLPLAVQITRTGHRDRSVGTSPQPITLVNAEEEPFPGEAERALVDGRTFVEPDTWGTETSRTVIGAPHEARGATTGAV